MENNILLLILLCNLSCISSQELVKTLSGQQVHLRCYINSTHDVTWYIDLGLTFVPVYTCTESGSCTSLNDVGDRLIRISGSRNNEVSIISFIPPRDKLTFECKLGDKVVKSYEVYLINPGSINEYCNVSFPSISESGDHQIILLCGYTFQGDLGLRANLTIEERGQNNFQTSFQNTNRTLHLDDNFNNIDDAVCEIYFTEINITRTCAYPAIIKTKYVVEGNGIIVQSADESEVDWQLFGKDGREQYIFNRTWTRDEGRSLLLRGITEEDVGKLVVWRTKGAENQTNNGTIGFTVISDIPEDSNKQDSDDKKPAPPRAQSPFFVLTLLFLALWLITIIVGGIILFCREEKCRNSPSVIPSTSGNAKPPNSNQSSNVKTNGNVGSGDNGTPLVRLTTEATNPDISNTNNSAHTPVLERDDSNDDTLNRQSQGNSHLYFTLEKSPSASFRRASAPRWTHGDASTATLDQDQDILWQGYATVGDSNENATCSYDLGEYAEVGEHLIQRKGPPVQSVRPPVRKKPGREEVPTGGGNIM